MLPDQKDYDLSQWNEYGDAVNQIGKEETKRILNSQIEYQTKIDYPFNNTTLDLALIEDNTPILNILVKDYKWDTSRRAGLLANKEVCWTNRIEKHYNLSLPLYICLSSKRIKETVRFTHLWKERKMNELYKLYPNDISLMNQRRK